MKKLFTLLVVLCFMCEAFAENHLFEMSTSQAKANAWDWGVSYQLTTPLVKGTKYVLTLKASTTDANYSLIYFWPYVPLYNEDGTPQLNQWGGQATATQYLGFGIDNQFIERQFPFIADYDLTTLVFNFGTMNGKLFFDDIKLVKEGTDDNLIIDGDFENGSEFVSNWKFEGNKPTTYAIKVEDFTPDPIKITPLGLNDIKNLKGNCSNWASNVSYPKSLASQGERFGCHDGGIENTVNVSDYETLAFIVSEVRGNGAGLRVWTFDSNNNLVTLYPYPANEYNTADFTVPYAITTPGIYMVNISAYDKLRGIKAANSFDPPFADGTVTVDYAYVFSGAAPVAKAIDGYRHFSCSKALDFSSVNGVEAYIVPECADGKVYMQKVKDVVPANTGLILKSNLDDVTITIPAVKPFDSTLVNLLVPVADATEINKAEKGNNYLYDGTKWVAVSAPTAVPAGSCYLPVNSSLVSLTVTDSPISVGDSGFIEVEGSPYDPDKAPEGGIESATRPDHGLVDAPSDTTENNPQNGTATGINSADAGSEIVSIVTANGAKVNTLQKGINIVTYSNGKRVKVIK